MSFPNKYGPYEAWKQSDAIVVIGFGFGLDDEHINGIIRTLLDDGKKVIIVALDSPADDAEMIIEYARKLKTSKSNNISIVRVTQEGKVKDTDEMWVDALSKFQVK